MVDLTICMGIQQLAIVLDEFYEQAERDPTLPQVRTSSSKSWKNLFTHLDSNTNGCKLTVVKIIKYRNQLVAVVLFANHMQYT